MMRFILFILLPLTLFSACSPCIKAGGELESRTLMLEHIEAIDLKGSAQVRLFQGQEQKIEVTAPSEAFDYLNQSVNSGTWEIYFDPCVKDEDVIFNITLTDLREAIVTGSGTITGNGYFNTSDVRLLVNGSGEISATINAADVLTIVSGSGDVRLDGSTNNLQVEVSGSGEVDASDFISQSANAVVSGSGEVALNVRQQLTAAVTGSGNILYYGSPASVKTDIQGSGEIIKK